MKEQDILRETERQKRKRERERGRQIDRQNHVFYPTVNPNIIQLYLHAKLGTECFKTPANALSVSANLSKTCNILHFYYLCKMFRPLNSTFKDADSRFLSNHKTLNWGKNYLKILFRNLYYED